MSDGDARVRPQRHRSKFVALALEVQADRPVPADGALRDTELRGLDEPTKEPKQKTSVVVLPFPIKEAPNEERPWVAIQK